MWALMFGVGVALEVLGLIVVAIGIRATWRANARGEPFTHPIREAIKRAGWWVNARLPRRLRRSRVIEIHVSDGLAIGSYAYSDLATGWQPLAPDLPAASAIAELDARFRRVLERTQEAERAIHRRLDELASNDGELGQRIDQQDEQLAETARLLRVEGLRGQAVGIGLLAFGLVLQTMGQIGL